MFTLSSMWEGFARGLLYFHPACPERSRWAQCLASRGFSLNSIIPTHPRCQGEGGYTGFFVRPIRRALSTETPLSPRFPFIHLRTLSFSVSHLSPVSPALSALFPKKQGVLLSGHTNCSRADRTCKTRPPRKAAATGELFHESPDTDHESLFTGRWPLVAGHFFPYTSTEVTPQ